MVIFQFAMLNYQRVGPENQVFWDSDVICEVRKMYCKAPWVAWR